MNVLERRFQLAAHDTTAAREAFAGLTTFLICRDLRDRPRSPIARPEAMTVRRTPAGGFEELHEAAPSTQADDEVRSP